MYVILSNEMKEAEEKISKELERIKIIKNLVDDVRYRLKEELIQPYVHINKDYLSDLEIFFLKNIDSDFICMEINIKKNDIRSYFSNNYSEKYSVYSETVVTIF